MCKRVKAFLTQDIVINGIRYRRGTKFTFGDPLSDGRYHIVFELPTGPETVLTSLLNLKYRLL